LQPLGIAGLNLVMEVLQAAIGGRCDLAVRVDGQVELLDQGEVWNRAVADRLDDTFTRLATVVPLELMCCTNSCGPTVV